MAAGGGRIEDFAPEQILNFISTQDDLKSQDPPYVQRIDTVAVFADVSGFTSLTEELGNLGDRGAEVLGGFLNRYFEQLVKQIAKSGGDVFKFAGDAMIILWQPTLTPSGDVDLKSMVLRAATCASDIQSRLHNAAVGDDSHDVRFSIKLGIGAGSASVLHVGGVLFRLEYLVCGQALSQALHCEGLCVAGDTVLSRHAYELVRDCVEGMPKGKHGDHKLVKVTKRARNVSVKKTILGSESGRDMLKRYVPDAIRKHISSSTGQSWSAELRTITVLFVNLGFKATDMEGEGGEGISFAMLENVQRMLRAVQSSVYEMEGSLNKFLMDDKGATLLACLGLPPLAHEEDPSRGVLLALKLVQTAKDLDQRCYIGITTGVALCGPVGSGNRREYSVLGDVVNTSARLMAAAGKGSSKMTKGSFKGKSYSGQILCDKATKDSAESLPGVVFESLTPLKLKGKSKLVQIFQPGMALRPRDLEGEVRASIERSQGQGLAARITDEGCGVISEAGRDEYENDYVVDGQRQHIDILILFEEMTSAESELCAQTVMVSGENGSGKTTMLRQLEKVMQDEFSALVSYVHNGEVRLPASNDRVPKRKRQPLILRANADLWREWNNHALVWTQVVRQLEHWNLLHARAHLAKCRIEVTELTRAATSLSSKSPKASASASSANGALSAAAVASDYLSKRAGAPVKRGSLFKGQLNFLHSKKSGDSATANDDGSDEEGGSTAHVVASRSSGVVASLKRSLHRSASGAHLGNGRSSKSSSASKGGEGSVDAPDPTAVADAAAAAAVERMRLAEAAISDLRKAACDILDSQLFQHNKDVTWFEQQSSGRRRRDGTVLSLLRGVTQMFDALVERNPVILILDQCQWMSTVDWEITQCISEYFEKTDRELLLVIATRPLHNLKYRPYFRPESESYRKLLQKETTEFINMRPMIYEDTRALIKLVLGVATVPDSLVQLAQWVACGNPVFIVKFLQSLQKKDLSPVSSRGFICADHLITLVNCLPDQLKHVLVKLLSITTTAAGRVLVHQKFEDITGDNDKIVELPVSHRVQRIIGTFLDRLTPEQSLLLKCAAVLCRGGEIDCLAFELSMLMVIFPDTSQHKGDAETRLVQYVDVLKQFGLILVHSDVNYRTTVLSSAMIAGHRQHAVGGTGGGAPESSASVLNGRLFRFDSGFTRDAVYRRTLYKQRIRMHKLMADHVEANLGASRRSTDPIHLYLFRHYTLAEEHAKAAKYYEKRFGYPPPSTTAAASAKSNEAQGPGRRRKKSARVLWSVAKNQVKKGKIHHKKSLMMLRSVVKETVQHVDKFDEADLANKRSQQRGGVDASGAPLLMPRCTPRARSLMCARRKRSIELVRNMRICASACHSL